MTQVKNKMAQVQKKTPGQKKDLQVKKKRWPHFFAREPARICHFKDILAPGLHGFNNFGNLKKSVKRRIPGGSISIFFNITRSTCNRSRNIAASSWLGTPLESKVASTKTVVRVAKTHYLL